MPLPQLNTRLTEYSLIHKGKRFGGLDECLEQEENRTLAEDLLISSDLSLITLEAKKGRGLPKIIKLRYLQSEHPLFKRTTSIYRVEPGGNLMVRNLPLIRIVQM